MLVSFEITDTKELEALQKKILENKRQTDEEHDTWMSDTDKLEDYIFQCISTLISMKGAPLYEIREKSNVWEYQVCTDDREELYMM
jgi:hypothetical protein